MRSGCPTVWYLRLEFTIYNRAEQFCCFDESHELAKRRVPIDLKPERSSGAVMSPTSSQIHGIDLDAPGKQCGYFAVDHSNNEFDAAVIPVPIAVITGGVGPTTLLVAGTHGDEYEGQILLHELIRQIDPAHVTGRIIILPALNLLAVRQGTRVSGVDGANLNRTMPGDPYGGPAEQIANIVATELLPLADFMIDIHSGGSNSVYLPSTFVYAGPTESAWQKKVDAVNAINLPYAIVVEPGLKSGSLSGAADAAGVWMISTELGGSGTIDSKILARARTGLRHLLAAVGVLPDDGPAKPAGEKTDSSTVWVALESDSTIHSTVSGLFEPTVELGQSVEVGQLIGRVHFIEELGRSAEEFSAPFDGIVAVTRHPTLVAPGSALINIAIPMKGPHQRS